MVKKIYIGNLPWGVTKVKLEDLFKSFGEMEEALIVANKYSGKSRGFGFVTFKDEKSAKKAISEMHEKDVEGRKIVVKEAMPMRSEQQDSGEGEKKEEKAEELMEKPEKAKKEKKKPRKKKEKAEEAE